MIRSRFIRDVNRIFAILLVMFACWPYFSQNIGLIGVLLLAVGWCATTFLLSDSHVVGLDGLWMSSYAVIMLFSYLLYGRVYANYELYYFVSMVMLFFLPYYMFRFYSRRGENAFLGKLAVVALVFMLVGALTSSYYTYLKPGIMKTISQALDTEFVEYRKVGIGSFGFIYMTMLMLIALIGQWKRRQKMPVWMHILTIVFFVAGVKCIIDSTFTTALLLLVVGALLILITSRKNPLFNVITYILILVAVILLDRAIGTYLANVTLPSRDVTIRLNEIGQFLLGEEAGENMESRQYYLTRSFQCFARYPLLGYNFAATPEISSGNHSQWIDMFAIYGLIGGIPLLATIVTKLRRTAEHAKKEIGYPYFGVVLFIFIVYGFLDPFLNLYNIGFAMFLLIPAIGCLSMTKKERMDSENSRN